MLIHTRTHSSGANPSRLAWVSGWALALLILGLSGAPPVQATHETAAGEIENRPASVFRRICVAGTNAGNLCKQDSECPGSSCSPKNIFNLVVAFEYDAPGGDIADVQNLITDLSEVLLDVTDGQAEIGQVTLVNNADSTTQADLLIRPTTNDTWWKASSGHYRTGGSMKVSINYVNPAVNQGSILAHEFVHLVFDARDEYEIRPGCGNSTSPIADCPDQDAIDAGEVRCLMDGNGSELCWGQGDPTDLTDITGGNHDATNVTEQSECRSDRSCWDQVAWSWPTTFLEPAAAPVAGNGGATVVPPVFVEIDDSARVVLVLDESGSMILESPSRMERLKVAADDFVTLAEDGTEIGIVSYATDALVGSGRVNQPIAAITSDRSALKSAISGMAPDSMTNIGDGLEEAKQMIVDAGGVTSNTFIVLMTDGLNNQPPPQATADADLTAGIADLLASGIPVYVTCTGGDLGLQSQCSEIATGTGGFYTDSADASRLPETFVDFQERISGREAIDSFEGFLGKVSSENPTTIFVDEGSESATFTLVWENPEASANLVVVSPGGTSFPSRAMPQGRYVRVESPEPGDWTLRIDPGGYGMTERRSEREYRDSRYVARGYTKNRVNSLHAALRYPSILPGGEMYVYAFPESYGGNITDHDAVIEGRVTLPDGSVETFELHDRGRDATGHGDDIPADGVFTGIFRNTEQKGAYTLQLAADIEGWELGHDAHERDESYSSPRFQREIRLSAAVGDPNDVVREPEDGPLDGPGSGATTDFEGWVQTILIIIVVLLVLLILLLWLCCRKVRHSAATHGH